MTFRKAARLFSTFFFASFLSCNPIVIVAYLDAQIAPEGDVTGQQTVQTKVSFTNFQPELTGGNLNLTFTVGDPDGGTNQMVIVLKGNSSGGVSTGDFKINGTNGNSFSVSVIVRRETSVVEVQEAVASSGTVRLSAINIANGQVKGAQGEFTVYFPNGGSAVGWFKASDS